MTFDAFGLVDPNSRSVVESSVYSHGVYAELQFRPMSYFKVQTGVRYEEHSTAGSEAIPRLGIIVNPYDELAIKMSTGKHFRAPTINDLFWPDTGYVKGNPNLVAETGWHSDVTVEQLFWQKKAMASISYFKTDIDDKIDWAEDPNDPNIINWGGYWKPTNVNKFESHGVEVAIQASPLEALEVNLSYTWLDAEEEQSPGAWRQATNTAENTFKTEASYFFAFGLTAALTVRYVDERPSAYASDSAVEPEHSLDSYWTTDLKLSQVLGDHWLLAVTATNLFDKGYATNSADFYDDAYPAVPNCEYPGAEQSFFGTVTYEF